MTMHVRTRLAAAVAGGAAVVLLASPAFAADTVFPAKATTTFGGPVVTATITIPALNTPCYKASVVGQKWAATVAPTTVVCAAGAATWTVTPAAPAAARRAKATVVVKFTPVNPDGSAYTGPGAGTTGVKSLQVKIGHAHGKPAAKPAGNQGRGNG